MELHQFCSFHNCEHLVDFFGAYYSEGKAMLVLEYMNRGSLEHVIQTIGALPEYVIIHIARQVFTGLEYLHERSSIHRDIKPGNILIDRNGLVKLTDFGLAVMLEDDDVCHQMVGTKAYMSPERIDGLGYGAPADVWAVGLVLIYCGLGKSPVHINDGFFALREQICNAPLPSLPESQYSEGLRDLISHW